MSLRLGAALLVPALLTGCYKTWVEVNPGLATAEAQPALVVSSTIFVQQDDDAGVAGAVVAMMDNSELNQVGPKVLDSLKPWLQERGVGMVVDAERAKRTQSVDLGDLANDLSVLSGAWFDPRGSTLSLDNRTLNRRAYSRRLTETIDDPDVQDAYLYVVVQVSEKAPAILIKRPALDLSVLVVDEQGEDLLRARGWGFGDASPFIVRNDADNLTVALKDAVANLEVAETKPTRAPKN